MEIAHAWKELRRVAGYSARSALARDLKVSEEYVRQIEHGRLPSEKLMEAFIRLVRPARAVADDLRQELTRQRIRRHRGADLDGYKDATGVAGAVCTYVIDDLKAVGLMEEDCDFILGRIREEIVRQLR